MGNHTPTVFTTNGGRWVGKCTCRWRAPDVCDTRQGAEDSNLKHLQDVDRLRAHNRRGAPTLKQQRDYYLHMADQSDTDPEDAALWRRLGNEISRRLNEDHPPSEGQDALW